MTGVQVSPEIRAYVDKQMEKSHKALLDSSAGRMRDYDPPSGRKVLGETLRGWIVETEWEDLDGNKGKGPCLETDYDHLWYFKSPEGTLHRGPTSPDDNCHYADFYGYGNAESGFYEMWMTYRSNPGEDWVRISEEEAEELKKLKAQEPLVDIVMGLPTEKDGWENMR